MHQYLPLFLFDPLIRTLHNDQCHISFNVSKAIEYKHN